MRVNWKSVASYEDTKGITGVVYVHLWDDNVYYIGKAHNSTFGGSSNSRYNVAYRHWIDGCLEHGAKLYFGFPEEAHSVPILEETLILALAPRMNSDFGFGQLDFGLECYGEVPLPLIGLTAKVIRNRSIRNYLARIADKIAKADKQGEVDWDRFKALVATNDDSEYFGLEKVIDIFERFYSDVEKIPRHRLGSVTDRLEELYRASKLSYAEN